MKKAGLKAGEASMAAPELGPNGYASAVLEVLINPVLVVDSALAVLYANPAAEQFFQSSAGMLRRQKLPALVPATSPIVPLVRQVQSGGNTTSEYEVDLGTPKTGPRLAHITVAAMMDRPGEVVLTLQETTMASKMDRQLLHRNAARSVTGMASVLAHEVKNPLAGIRGAAQLLETAASEDDRALTQLICDETDRIVAMVERMEMFSDHGLKRDPVNIHEVLERVRRIAGVGFASNVRILEDYDPSLPSVPGDFDQLVQVFLNLLKNAAEAVAPNGGEIVVHTAFRHGVRLEVPGTDSRQKLPLEVIIQDNGPGVPEDILPYIFDPFITTKSSGTGLGLPLVAKIIGDHGGIVECDTTPHRTVFRVLLPMSEETKVSRK